MFQWFARWLEARRRRKSRLIFKYWTGDRWKYGDPMLLWRKIVNHPGFNLEHGPLVDRGEEPETTAWAIGLADVFGVERWNPDTQTGLTDWEILDLLPQLTAYMETVKKKYSPGPISPAPTDLASSTSTARPSETTKPCADSTPAGIEANCAEATPS